MIEVLSQDGSDRVIIRLDPGRPIDLDELTSSFAALASLYARHHRPEGLNAPAPRLYVERLESGSIIAEIVPYVVILGALVPFMDSAIIVSDFTMRLKACLKAFSDPYTTNQELADYRPTEEDAEDIKAFVRPLTGKAGAKLGIAHARLTKMDGKRETVVEYNFDEREINRAVINIDEALNSYDIDLKAELPPPEPDSSILREVMLFFEQASRKPGKEKGRTGDKGVVPDVTDKSLSVYFRKSVRDLKDKMIKGDVNPLTDSAFVVDVHVQRIDGEPKAYIVTDVHEVVPLDNKDAD